MLYIAENLKSMRKGKDLTQEDVAEMLGVSPQSVSKWERGDTYPDITLLPALANLYKTSVDALIGMNKINDNQVKTSIFNESHKHFRNKDYNAVITVLSEALKTFPNDEGFMSELAIALALYGGTDSLSQAVTLCERILSGNAGEKFHHTTRATLCFIYYKAGLHEKAVSMAKNLPHIRESRETVLKQLQNEPNMEIIDEYLKFITISDSDHQDIITIDFGIGMIPTCSEYDLTGKIEALRKEISTAPHSNEGHTRLPIIRIRDNASLTPNQVRMRYYADYLMDKEFGDCNEATNEIMSVIRKIAHV